jgi:hypothetical protein
MLSDEPQVLGVVVDISASMRESIRNETGAGSLESMRFGVLLIS